MTRALPSHRPRLSTNLAAFCLAMLAVAPCVFAQRPQREASGPAAAGYLHVAAGRVVDEAGVPVRLRGFCLDPWRNDPLRDTPHPADVPDAVAGEAARVLFDHFASNDDFKQMAAMGANVVRKFIQFYPLEAAPFRLRPDCFAVVDDLVAKAKASGLYVVLCLTECAQNPHQEGNKAVYGGRALLWEDAQLQRRVLYVWERIAARYANEPTIAAYEILNEPVPPTPQALHAFNAAAIAAIRKHDKRHIIMIERSHRFTKLRGRDSRAADPFARPYADANIMYSWHYYPDGDAKVPAEERAHPSVTYPSREAMKQAIAGYLRDQRLQPGACMVTECGALTSSGSPGLRWTEDFFQLLNATGVHWTYFCYKNIYPGSYRGVYIARPPGPGAVLRRLWSQQGPAALHQAARAFDTANFQRVDSLGELLSRLLGG